MYISQRELEKSLAGYIYPINRCWPSGRSSYTGAQRAFRSLSSLTAWAKGVLACIDKTWNVLRLGLIKTPPPNITKNNPKSKVAPSPTKGPESLTLRALKTTGQTFFDLFSRVGTTSVLLTSLCHRNIYVMKMDKPTNKPPLAQGTQQLLKIQKAFANRAFAPVNIPINLHCFLTKKCYDQSVRPRYE